MNSKGDLSVEQVNLSGGAADAEGPGWAPLRDNYMLTNSKLKDWDKMAVRYFQSLISVAPVSFCVPIFMSLRSIILAGYNNFS